MRRSYQSVRKPPTNQPSTAQFWPTHSAKPKAAATGDLFANRLGPEYWLAHKLYRAGVSGLTQFPGITDFSQRRETLRRQIGDLGLADTPVPRNHDERVESFSEAFARVFQEPLCPTHTHDEDAA